MLVVQSSQSDSAAEEVGSAGTLVVDSQSAHVADSVVVSSAGTLLVVDSQSAHVAEVSVVVSSAGTLLVVDSQSAQVWDSVVDASGTGFPVSIGIRVRRMCQANKYLHVGRP